MWQLQQQQGPLNHKKYYIQQLNMYKVCVHKLVSEAVWRNSCLNRALDQLSRR